MNSTSSAIVLVVTEADHRVFEAQEDAGIDVQGQMEVEWPTTAIFWVQVDLPHLSKRVGLDEVPLVMHVKSVIHGMILDFRHIAGDVDSSHVADTSGISHRTGWLGCVDG